MSNDCNYSMVAVSYKKSALEKLINIMNYKDENYYIYRVKEVDSSEIYSYDNYYCVDIFGIVAWSCYDWFNSKELPEELIMLNYNQGNPIYGTAHYITMDLLCKKLKIGIELYSDECGCCFQEHYHVDHEGNILIKDCVEWQEIWEDENGNEFDEPLSIGGFPNYGCFMDHKQIY